MTPLRLRLKALLAAGIPLPAWFRAPEWVASRLSARGATVVAALVWILLLGSCRREAPELLSEEEMVHTSLYDIYPDSIDLHTGVVLRAAGDSALEVRVEGNTLRSIAVPQASGAAFNFAGDYPLLGLLLRLESMDSGDAPYTATLPIELYFNPLLPQRGIELLQARLKNELVVPVPSAIAQWPVLTDNALWLMAATELYKSSGRRRWLELTASVAEKVTAYDCRINYNCATGLFRGIPPYIFAGYNRFPDWMKPAQMFSVSTLSLNTAYWSVARSFDDITYCLEQKNEHPHLPELPYNADTLRHAINTRLWLPDAGCYSSLLYGTTRYPVELRSVDFIGQSLAILSGMAGKNMAASATRKTPLIMGENEIMMPRWTARTSSDLRLKMLAQAMWAAAAGKARNGDVMRLAMGNMLYTAASRVMHNWQQGSCQREQSISGFILRGLLGAEFAADGIRLEPFVPPGMNGEKKITDLRYRKMTLTIELRGYGSQISACMLDGKESEPFIPSSLEGEHHIILVLTPAETSVPDYNITQPATLPSVPWVEWSSATTAAIMPEIATTAGAMPKPDTEKGKPEEITVIVDGLPVEKIARGSFTIHERHRATETCFAQTVDSRNQSFTSAPHLYAPEGSIFRWKADEVGRTGTSIIKDRKSASAIAELNRYRNSPLTFEFESPYEGEYLLDAEYLSALGIVNRKRGVALRSVRVNGTDAGVLVFPQESAATIDIDNNESHWYSHTSFCPGLPIRLKKGANVIEIRFWQPSPVYINPTANTLLIKNIRLIKI